MGAWGTAPFDNDDAADWAAELDEAEDPSAFVTETLTGVLASDYVEVDAGNEAVAAAAWLASALPGGLSLDPNYGPATRPNGVSRSLADTALSALGRVTGESSEWRELWDETDEATNALAAVESIAEVLRTVA